MNIRKDMNQSYQRGLKAQEKVKPTVNDCPENPLYGVLGFSRGEKSLGDAWL